MGGDCERVTNASRDGEDGLEHPGDEDLTPATTQYSRVLDIVGVLKVRHGGMSVNVDALTFKKSLEVK
jgi:hypothetical protein